MKIFILFFIYFFTFFSSFSQTSKDIDSLKTHLLLERNDNKKIDLYNSLSIAHIYSNSTTSQQYNDSLSILSKKLNNEEMMMNALYNDAVIKRTQGNYEEAIELQKKYIVYLNKKEDTAKLAKSYYQIGASYIRMDKLEIAIKNLTKSLSFTEAIGDDSQSSKTLNAIGVIYQQLHQFDRAHQYYNKAIIINERLKDTFALALIFNGKGIVYMKQDSTSKALSYFQKSLKYGIIVDNKAVMSNQYRNIGTILKNRKEYKKAEKHHLKALEVRKKINKKLTIGGSYYDLGEVYLETSQLQKAENHFNKALVIFKKIKAKSGEQSVYRDLSKLESKKGNYKKSMKYLSMYHTMRDSLKNNELRKSVNDIAIKYETEKKDKEIIQQQLQLEKTESELHKKKIQYGFMTGLSIFLLVASILLWFLFKQRQKRKNQELITIKRETQIRSLESLIQGEEKERLRIAKELHDGVNGDLSAIKHKLNTLLKLNNETIAEAVIMIDKSCDQVRAISHNLVPPALENFDLKSAIADFCTNKNNLHKSQIKFNYLGDAIKLSKIVEINIFRIVQELVNNSIKHADATKINVQFSVRNNDIQLAVEDNGKGFNAYDIGNDGIGIANVKSRVSFLNGEIDFTSNNEGTSVNIFMDKTRFNDD